MTIIESGMTFGDFDPNFVFQIEKSQIVKDLGEGVKSVEFLLLRNSQGTDPQLWLVEAKSSAPNQENPNSSAKVDIFNQEIHDKFLNSFLIFLALRLGRIQDEAREMPAPLSDLPLDSLQFRLILVVAGHKDEWLIPLRDRLAQKIKGWAKSMNFGPSQLFVLNEDGARKRRLIQPAG